MLEKAYGESTLPKTRAHEWYSALKTRFQLVKVIEENSRRELKSIPENAFKKCFHYWHFRWHKCIISGGAYFESDKINLDEE